MPSDDGSRAIYIVKYSKSELNELERVIAYSQLDVKKLSRADLTRAIIRSFAESDRQTLPFNDQCYLAGATIYYLKEKIGLDICIHDFQFKTRLVNLSLICKVVTTSDASIKDDCFDLLYVFVTDLGIQAIQYLIDKKLMPTLVHTLVGTMNLAKSPKKSETAWILGEFASAGQKSLIDDQTRPFFKSFKRSFSYYTSLHEVGKIARVSVWYRDRVLESGVMRALVKALERQFILCNNWNALLKLASTLSMLCEGAPPPELVYIEPCLTHIYTFLNPTMDLKSWLRDQQKSSDCQVDTLLIIVCNTIVHLCGGPINLIELMTAKGIFDRLWCLLDHNSDEVNGLVLKAIGRLVIREKPFIHPIIKKKYYHFLRRLIIFLSKDGERYGVSFRQDACQILSIVVMCDDTGLKTVALSIDNSIVVLLCALVTIDTATASYGLKALKKVRKLYFL